MAYHVALEPRPFGRLIQESELIALGMTPVQGDGWRGLQLTGRKPFVLHCSNGEWFAERLDDDQIRALVKIAAVLDAVVVGDDGESYEAVDGTLTYHPLPPKEREFHFHRFNLWIGLVLILAFFVLIATLVRS